MWGILELILEVTVIVSSKYKQCKIAEIVFDVNIDRFLTFLEKGN